MSRPLEGRRALVTGGSRGIGRAIALGLVHAGAEVAITYRDNEQQAMVMAELLANAGQPDALVVRADSSDRSAMQAVMGLLETRWECLDILVNNAGINKPTDFDQISDEDWDRILSVNLKGPFICSQLALPMLAQSRHASIIMVGSVSGQYGGPRTAHYAASKAGLISLAQVVARFGARHGIRCNTVAAGIIASDMGIAGLAAPSVATVANSILLGRLGEQGEVADAVVFLASEASRYITAQTINVNGGLYF